MDDCARRDFEHFVARRGAALARTAYLLTGDWENGEDLLQTALVKAYLTWERLHHTSNAEAYVRRILYNTHASWSRRAWLGERPAGDMIPDLADTDVTASIDERQGLIQALRRLPPRQRAVVVLRYYEDLSEAAVAGVLGCSVGTVKGQSTKALRKLRCDVALGQAEAFKPSVKEVK